MTPAQFDCCTTRNDSPTLVAARMVLIDGASPSVAARETGVSAQSVCNAVARIERNHAAILAAYVTTPPPP